MSLALATWRAERRWRPSARALQAAAVLGACAAFLALDLRTAPIQLWDESRNAVNALEMHQHGLSLVTTYEGRPDLWNTKPPLLVWVMAGLMTVIGPGEAAVRLPSLLAALGVLALTMSFTRRVTGSGRAAALAAVLLTTSFGFFGDHGARTGDFDAPLCLFTTAYLYLLFFAVHRRRPRAATMLAAALLVAGAVLTKSVMGLVPGSGVAVYLLTTGRWRRPLSARYALAGLAAILPVGVFLLAREHVAAGYLRAVIGNDLGGRFGSTVEGHAGPSWFYVETLFLVGLMSAGPLALLAPLGLMVTRGPARLGLLFSLCVSGATLGVLSLSATKLAHYALPAYPFLAIACAIALQAALQSMRGRVSEQGWKAMQLVLALVLCLLVGRAVWLRTAVLARLEFQPKALYGELLRTLEHRGVREVGIVDGGVGTLGWSVAGVPADYAPQLRFYSLLAAQQGTEVIRLAPSRLAGLHPGTVVASCDRRYRAAVLSLGPPLAPRGARECVAVRTGAHA